MLRFPQRVRYISLYRCFSFFASTNLGNCVFQPSAAPVLRPAPYVCIISRNFINTSDFLIYFQKELAFSDGYAILFFAENNSPLRIASLLLFSFSSDRPEQAGIPLPPRSGLLFAFFRIVARQGQKGKKHRKDLPVRRVCPCQPTLRSANKTLKIRFPGTVSRICHLDAAG